MSMERLQLSTEPVLDLIRHSPAWTALLAIVSAVRRAFGLDAGAVEPDTSIAWEDGELEDDSQLRR
jgi:hypothetical protein